MVSLGGLDVAYGASTQLVRTNVLVLKSDAADHTKAGMKAVHNLAVSRFPASLKPDYTAVTHTNASTTGLGAAELLTDDVEGGLLKTLTRVPVMGGVKVLGTGETNTNDHRTGSVEAILNIGALEIKDAATSAANDLFAGTVDATGGASEPVVDANVVTSSEVESIRMAAIMNDAESGEAKDPVVGNLDLTSVVDAVTFAGTVTDTEVGTLCDVHESATGTSVAGTGGTAGTTLTGLKAVLDEGAYLFSVLALCKVA